MRRLPVLVFLLVGCGEPPRPDGAPFTFATTQGEGHGRLYRQAKGTLPAVIVLHGDHGLTPRIDEHARELSRRGYLVLAIDLYRGEKIDNLLDAHIMDRGLPEERVKADLRGAVEYLLAHKDVKKGGVGVIGWDMGGGYALDTAMADERIKAVVTCYGRLTTDPVQLRKMDASVLALMAGKDEGNPPVTREAFRAAMAEAGRKLSLHVFEECDHGFMNPLPGVKVTEADDKANERAWELITEFFDSELSR